MLFLLPYQLISAINRFFAFLKTLLQALYSSLREKCLYSQLFWSVFSRIRTNITPNTGILYAVHCTVLRRFLFVTFLEKSRKNNQNFVSKSSLVLKTSNNAQLEGSFYSFLHLPKKQYQISCCLNIFSKKHHSRFVNYNLPKGSWIKIDYTTCNIF